MTELSNYPLYPEWPHIRAMREKLLADIAIAEALRTGTAKLDDVEIEVTLKEEQSK